MGTLCLYTLQRVTHIRQLNLVVSIIHEKIHCNAHQMEPLGVVLSD